MAIGWQYSFSEPAVTERLAPPDQERHHVQREKHEPCDGQNHEKRGITAISLEAGAEKTGIGKGGRYQGRKYAASDRAEDEEQDVDEQSHDPDHRDE